MQPAAVRQSALQPAVQQAGRHPAQGGANLPSASQQPAPSVREPVAAVAWLESPDQVAKALTPLRRRLLERLRTPASAAELAPEFGQTRQRLNYHLRLLERLGLVELIELRRRRGFVERVLRTVGAEFIVDPGLVGPDPRPAPHEGTDALPEAPTDPPPGAGASPAAGVARADRHAADHLVRAAAETVRTVGRMSSAATGGGTRLLTFTVETDVRFAGPADVHRFTDELAEAVEALAARYQSPTGRSYRLLVAGHPTARFDSQIPTSEESSP